MSKLNPKPSFVHARSGFLSYLYQAYIRADSVNTLRMEVAFPHLFEGGDVTDVEIKEIQNVN